MVRRQLQGLVAQRAVDRHQAQQGGHCRAPAGAHLLREKKRRGRHAPRGRHDQEHEEVRPEAPLQRTHHVGNHQDVDRQGGEPAVRPRGSDHPPHLSQMYHVLAVVCVRALSQHRVLGPSHQRILFMRRHARVVTDDNVVKEHAAVQGDDPRRYPDPISVTGQYARGRAGGMIHRGRTHSGLCVMCSSSRGLSAKDSAEKPAGERRAMPVRWPSLMRRQRTQILFLLCIVVVVVGGHTVHDAHLARRRVLRLCLRSGRGGHGCGGG
mmetsp:Transcript_23653/g.37940  ORF Transcript_23653/g.37940 Transcript_23653/m.37940 type:complete len:266 (+) Transcript_23653:2591-3388(+)